MARKKEKYYMKIQRLISKKAGLPCVVQFSKRDEEFVVYITGIGGQYLSATGFGDTTKKAIKNALKQVKAISKSKNPDSSKGIYKKYIVQRKNDHEGKHDDCEFFVLDWEHDKFAAPAALAYAKACKLEFPALAEDLKKLAKMYSKG